MDPNPDLNPDPKKLKNEGSGKTKKKKKDRSKRDVSASAGMFSPDDGHGLASAADTLFPSLDAPPRRTSSRVEDGKKPAAPLQSSHAQADSLNQMEREVLAKSRASAARQTGTIAGVGRVQSRSMSSSSGVARTTALNQLEADVMIKNQSRGDNGPAAAVGAQTIQAPPPRLSKRSDSRNAGAGETMGGSQQGKGAPDSKASLRNLEQGIAAKTRGASAASGGAAPPSRTSSRLQQMEDDVRAKTQARSYVADPTPFSTNFRADSIQRSSLSEMEDEIAVKRRAAPTSMVSSTSSGASAKGSAAVASLRPSPDEYDENGFCDEYDADGFPCQKKMSSSETDGRPGPDTLRDGFGGAPSYQSSVPDSEGRSRQHGQPYGGLPIQESAPHSEETSRDVESNGIQAFVADPDVVDAVGVAAVMSEEEEERVERIRSRRYMMCGLLAFFALAAGIVAAVVLTVGKLAPAPMIVPTSMPSDIPSMAPSMAPTTNRLDAWLEALKSISTEEALTNRTSPQYQAALWVADEDELQLEVGSARGIQRYALAVFYFALDGDNWIECGRLDSICGGDVDDNAWLTGTENECGWLGVQCNIDNTVVNAIFFPRQLGNGLVGNIPEEIVQLTDLSALILQRDELSGTLPSFLGKLTKLEALFMLDCKLYGTIPPELLIGASLLGTIHFGENMLTGTIPTLVGRLPLRTFDVGENMMFGKIPSEIGLLSLLSKLTACSFRDFICPKYLDAISTNLFGCFVCAAHLELHDNALTGTIPSELYRATSLTRIRFQNNSLAGSLSSQIGEVLDLEELRLGDNSLEGSLPSSLYTMRNMVDFRFENNQLTGQLSSSIGKLNNTLRRVILANNQMTGPLPITAIESLGYLSKFPSHALLPTNESKPCAHARVYTFHILHICLCRFVHGR